MHLSPTSKLGYLSFKSCTNDIDMYGFDRLNLTAER